MRSNIRSHNNLTICVYSELLNAIAPHFANCVHRSEEKNELCETKRSFSLFFVTEYTVFVAFSFEKYSKNKKKMTLCVTPKEEQQFRKKYILNFDCLCEAREIKGKLELYNKKFFCCFVLCQLSPYRKKLLYIKRKSYLYNIVHGDSTSI